MTNQRAPFLTLPIDDYGRDKREDSVQDIYRPAKIQNEHENQIGQDRETH